jgi:DNA-binding HxlR family transcriptional regulator
VLLALEAIGTEADAATICAKAAISPYTLVKTLKRLVAQSLVVRRSEAGRVYYSVTTAAEAQNVSR